MDLSLPEASHLNTTLGFPNIEVNSNFLWLLFSLVSAISWVVYITYYNSRVAGYVITRITNRIFISDGYFKIGSFIIDALAGKVMFRDIVYITHDYSVRVQDGYLIFRWWHLSHSDTRLSVVLNGFELHTYNRSEMYSNLEKIFGLESHIFPDNIDKSSESKDRTNSNSTIDKSKKKQISEAAMARTWRDLIPVIKMDISSGRLVFGNRLVPTTLSITIEESHFVYSTKPAVNTLDRFMHFVKCKSENVRVMLVPSPKYTGMLDEPPRYMGEGFVLMSTNDLELYFYMDEPGVVPEQPVQITLANGDVVDSISPPLWDFSYGPWADRQREHLFKFFYPQTYLPMEVTKILEPGDKRQMQSFDIRLLLQYEATIDILFSKNKETNATHINVGAGSYLEITIPWLTLRQGYTTRINGQLLHLDATTSLQFRDFISTETLEFCVQCHYPLIWNDPQLWELSLTGCKTTVNLIFSHKWFFQDLINDWSSKQRPDILHFVPYTWRFGLTLKHCELLTLVNEYNWIDCSSVGQRQRLENTQIALCAYFLHLSFDLPFEEFLPETVPLNFSIQGESIDLSLFIPEYHTSRDVVLSLEKNSKVLSKDGSMTKKAELIPKWRNICVNSLGWVDFWWVPIGAINIGYVYHPSPPLGPTPQADISTPVKEELLLSPIRFPRNRKAHRPSHDGTQKFDPTILKPDKVIVELEIGPSVLLLYGTALRNFLNFKENIFGEDQMFNQAVDVKTDDVSHVPLELRDEFDERYYRPLEVDVSVIMHDIQAHLLKYCNENDPPCPVILIERFGFEMKKRYDQTELQLLISPSVVLVSDHINRPSKDKQLNQGRLTLSALQIRGHAMFSNEGCSLDEDTVEYAWLLEVQLGKLSGKLTTPQLHSIIVSLETLIILMADTENELNSPANVNTLTNTRITSTTKMTPQNLSQNVQQTIQQFLQQKTNNSQNKNEFIDGINKNVQKSEIIDKSKVINVKNEDVHSIHKLKYKFCRIAVDAIDFWLVETGAALQLWISPLRLSTCNLHGKQVGNGLSSILYGMSLRQLIWQHHKYSHTKQVIDSDLWLEVGAMNFAPLIIESAMSPNTKNQDLHLIQQKFLKTHDAKWKKLSFLWPELHKVADKCGCSGGCAFFGSNRNGSKFFKPSRKDLDEGINIAAFCVNENGKDPGFGQSILHEGLLIFRTPPYIVNEIFLQDSVLNLPIVSENAHTTSTEKEKKNDTHTSFSSPISLNERKISRRFSSTSIRSKDVPYSRLVDALPPKLDSDSKLHFEKGNLNVPDKETLPKNSISDSKLAVDYFAGQPKSVSPPSNAKVIQRTVSISSENHSEAFFSADEDLNINSHNSSLRNSVIGSKGTLIRQDGSVPKSSQKKYNSELSISADQNAALRTQEKVPIHASPTSPSECSKTKLNVHRNYGTSSHIHGLITPQRCPNSRSVSPRLPNKEVTTTSPSAHSSILHDTLIDSSDSYSSTSYASAVGSQEDLTLIDLHMQVNRQIIDSPMLMSSYVSHLSQVLVYVGGRFVPTMEKVTEGVTSFKMMTRKDYTENQITNNKCTSGWDQDVEDITTELPTGNTFAVVIINLTFPLAQEEELLSSQGDLQGDLDVMITPLLLESLQKFVDSLTLTVANLHPSTVINHLHASCIGEVEAANILKKRGDVHIAQSNADLSKCGVYEETIKSQLQAAITLPKINVTLLQVSIIEEIISFSALDNIRDLTCVSLFSLSFENVSTKLQFDKQQKEVLQVFHRPAVVQMGSKKVLTKAKAFLLGQHNNTIGDIIRGEPVSIESCDSKQEELVICLNVGKVHAQLRRLRNESSILDDAVITAIPAYFSKVFFTCSKTDEVPRRTNYYEKLGFIMFECGLEGIMLKLVKKSLLDQNGGSNECKTPIFRDNVQFVDGSACGKDEKLNPVESQKNDNDIKTVQPIMKDSANVSSSIIEFKVVWFNFAAPPRAPITRKIDYTRLDWNLLSTASPAINAWMNPSNRFAIRVVHMVRTMYRRSTAVVACLMSEALEAQGIHMTSKSRYGILRPLATTLQEDPSCQLCTILQKYILQSDVVSIEANLREGVIVLSRQWKNILHTPLLVEPNHKFRIKPLNVTIAVPKVEEEMGLTDGEASGNEEPDITDEHAMLLHSGIILKPQAHKNIVVLPTKGVDVGSSPRLSGTLENSLLSPQVAVVSGGVESVLTSPSPPVNHRKYKNLQANTVPSSSRTSVVFPILSGTTNLFVQKKAQDETNGYGVLREDKNAANMGSDPSVCTHSSPELPSSPLHRNTTQTKSSEDLYRYMESKINTLQTDSSGDDHGTDGCIALYPMQDSLRLLDAHFIFQPLLSSLGVMSRQLVNTVTGSNSESNVTSLDALGSNLSLIGNMETMRIDIIVSEHGKLDKKRKGKSKPKFTVEINADESYAFMCEKISIEVEMDRKADMTVNDMIKTKNVLYISRGQLKKHTSTILNFNIGVRFIAQRVNMPLLRLLHQITNMYQNVKDAQNELREQLPIEIRHPKTSISDHTDIKHHSSSASDLQDAHPHVTKLSLKISDPESGTALISPSPSVRSRPQSFAQKLRSTGKSVKGYVNLSEGGGTPIFTSSPSGSALEHISHVSSEKSAGRCWKTIYHLLDLFSMGAADISEYYKGKRKYDILTEVKSSEDIEKVDEVPAPTRESSKLHRISNERTKLIMLGVARIHKTKLLATLSGLKLDAEITGLHSSVTCRSKSRPISLECSITGQIGRTTIKLLEGVAPNQLQTVVKATVGKSQVLCSSMSRKSKDKNSALLTIGAVVIEIPQHPVALHGMVTRSSKQLSSTLQVCLFFLSITAALLPSLQAQYKMDQLKSMGTTGSKAKFTIDLPRHSLSFTTIYPLNQGTDINLPTEASIALPVVHVSAEYIPEGATGPFRSDGARGTEGVVFRQGGYLSAQGDIGVFEHSLTTDLLNHLVFVQNIFMKEVNEVIQKVYGGERPVPIWLEDTEESSSLNRLLFSLIIKIQRIQLTATTAGSSAVRLETGAVTLELSNRVQNVSGCTQNNSTARLFGRAQVDLNLSLGQLLRNALFEEAETEFQQFAFFNTRIGLRNAFQDEIIEGEDKEVVLITLKRPLIYVQPVAVDKAILVWLNYKNAYDYWNEKRSSIQQNYEKLQIGQLTSQLSAQHLGTLFLQLTVEDMGICLPLNPLPLATWTQRCIYEECRGAVVVTLESTSISACSSGSLVSKGKFSNLCLRFAEDFETSLDDWKPDMGDCNIMNLCVVSEGTYEVCSRTITGKQCNENAKWFLNVQWQMEGVDIHLDTNVGKQLSALGHTLTSLTGAEVDPVDYDSDENDATDGTKTSQESILPSFMLDPTLNNRQRSKLIEKEMNEQAKIINDLRSLGASHGTIELELKRLHELEAMVYKDFRRDMMQKLRRQSVKASTITKGKLGIGNNAYRSKSFVVPSPTIERRSPDMGNGSYESSPCSGPSRSASLRVKGNSGPRVTFSDTQMCRQSSLPTASSDINIPESQLDWVDHLTVDGEKVELRKKLPPSYESDEVSANVSQPGMTQKSQEPNIDLELDVKVLIKSGKCVLHTKDVVRDEDIKLNRMRKDRSCSTGLLEFSVSNSPDPSRRNKEKLAATTSNSRLRTNPHTSLVDLTIFHIPGMDVKLHYQSKVINDVEQNQFADSKDTNVSSDGFSLTPDSIRNVQDELRIENAFKRKDSNLGTSLDSKIKYGKTHFGQKGDFVSDAGSNLKGSTSLHGISNPNYSDSPISSRSSLENVPQLEMNIAETYKAPSVTLKKFGIKKASLFAWMTLQSVPEETIVSPHILEFLEQTLEPIPAKTFSATGNNSMLSSGEQDLSTYGNYVYASFPVDVIVYFHMQPSTFRFSCLPVSRVECMLQLPSLDIVFSSKRAEDELLQSEFRDDTPNSATAVGGLSVTGCLSDFSVYIFHPYGGKKSALKEAQWSPLSDSERKDSLSINVEFVKFHLSRSRMLNLHQESPKGKLDQSKAVIRFSTITDIGSASFKYDMRRLTEILAFPKAWYRRSIVRRLFLGDLSMAGAHNEDEGTAPSVSPTSSRHYDNRSSKSPNLLNKEKLKISIDSERHVRLKEVGRAFSGESGITCTSSPEHKNMTSWETLVLFAVNFKKLNVHMNMGNVMGNVTWLTKDFRSEGRLSIGSTGYKNLYIAFGLGGSGLDAKGGIVGGNIEIANIDTFIHIREEPNMEPDHTIGIRLYALELRLDYMATSVLMTRVSNLSVNVKDEWKLNRSSSGTFIPTRRPASIFVHGDLSWDQLQIMISKSSTADLLKMFNKLEEFFSQQFNSSKRAFSGFSQTPHAPRITSQKNKEAWSGQQQSTFNDARHHRHWQRVLEQVTGLQLSTMHTPLPTSGTVLGGTMELHGNNISLACFHGINFKSKSWALFSLREPCITFNTEAQEIPATDLFPTQDVHVVQTLTCSLGLSTYKTHHSMATVCKVSRNVLFPPQFKSLLEWFQYAFANSQIDEVDRFPSLEKEKFDSIERSRGATQKQNDPNHNREVIFALPSLQLHLKTEHLQTASTPNLTEDKPVVECSFITEFEDHIFVTVDAEAFFFLHDLITSYLKEKERVFGSLSVTEKKLMSEAAKSSKASVSSESQTKKSFDDIFTKDWRNYNCKTWHLEPTVRLLSVAGKYIEPYGIDYILQKLGFSHARTTIPKWMQRGFMDPFDAILAVITLKMVQVVKGEGNKNEKEKIEQSKNCGY
ncbi:hypothetical protein RI129_012347 [Pyrocoelia pectoralis]|uniref:Bridge-like lipid transfer protein family member 1 C-terminal domain-containing protein n=1 Tax=Pyrocoelia pectoralis TaxID=417401 RepID=A0AAN7UXR2_9COLE